MRRSNDTRLRQRAARRGEEIEVMAPQNRSERRELIRLRRLGYTLITNNAALAVAFPWITFRGEA